MAHTIKVTLYIHKFNHRIIISGVKNTENLTERVSKIQFAEREREREKKVNIYLPSSMMKVPNHLYVLGDTYTCHTYCCYAYHFYAYWLYFIYVWHVYVSHKTYKWIGTFIIKDGRYTFTFFVPLLLPQSSPTQVLTQRVWRLTFREYSKCVTRYTICVSVAVNVPGMTSLYGAAREKRYARSQGHTKYNST
jgi:hypothetical protein